MALEVTAEGRVATVRLRAVTAADLEVFFAHQADPAAAHMARFPSRDRSAHFAVWDRALADPQVRARTIVVDDAVAGSIVSFVQSDERLVGYWLGREFWGRGVATHALANFLPLVPERPLRARVAKSNAASRRVLEKCGFRVVGDSWTPAREGWPEVDEWIFRLDDPSPAEGARP